jgi:hypothetical protein
MATVEIQKDTLEPPIFTRPLPSPKSGSSHQKLKRNKSLETDRKNNNHHESENKESKREGNNDQVLIEQQLTFDI